MKHQIENCYTHEPPETGDDWLDVAIAEMIELGEADYDHDFVAYLRDPGNRRVIQSILEELW